MNPNHYYLQWTRYENGHGVVLWAAEKIFRSERVHTLKCINEKEYFHLKLAGDLESTLDYLNVLDELGCEDRERV